MMGKRKKRMVYLLVGVLLFTVFAVWQNNDIVISRSEYESEKVPEAFEGFTIAHISDLHNKSFGKEQSTLLKKIKTISPDIIVITGDLIDRRRYDPEPAIEFIQGAIKLAPVYYVCGNHEAWSGKYEEIKEMLSAEGVHILENTCEEIVRGEETLNIIGIADPGLYTYGRDASEIEENEEAFSVSNILEQWSGSKGFQILLCHRPELLSVYAEHDMDLVFTGHAHGGQFRIPGVGGFIAPNQGLFPAYTSGAYIERKTTMYVSRGLGNSLVPIRIFNRPEIVVVTLKSELC